MGFNPCDADLFAQFFVILPNNGENVDIRRLASPFEMAPL
jgi:hypothetical protein